MNRAPDPEWPTLNEVSLRYVHRVLEHTGGNKTRAAAVLGIDQRTVHRLLRQVRNGKTPAMRMRPRAK